MKQHIIKLYLSNIYNYIYLEIPERLGHTLRKICSLRLPFAQIIFFCHRPNVAYETMKLIYVTLLIIFHMHLLMKCI